MAAKIPSLVEIFQMSISGLQIDRWMRVRRAIYSITMGLLDFSIPADKTVEAVDMCYPNISPEDWEIVMIHTGFIS